VYFLLVIVSLVVSTSAVNCLQRLISEMTCYVSSVVSEAQMVGVDVYLAVV